MMGLVKGLAWKAYKDTYPINPAWQVYFHNEETFGLVNLRSEIHSPGLVPASVRYFELIDACPLRMNATTVS
jgi:hypothetical protein